MKETLRLILTIVASMLVLFALCYGAEELPGEWDSTCEVNYTGETSDGGQIMVGRFWTTGVGQYDFWVLKFNRDGTIAWQKTYGGKNWDTAFSAQQTTDGGYVVAGSTESFGAGDDDFWVLRLNSDGTIAWQKTYGGARADYAKAVQQTKDGGFILVGPSDSFDPGWGDFWVLKLNPDGTIAWQKRYGGEKEEDSSFYNMPLMQTTDGGYIIAGSTKSFGAGDEDIWVLKLNSDGSIAWQNTYGTEDEECPTAVVQTSDGGYVVTGSSRFGGNEAWVINIDQNGTLISVLSGEHKKLISTSTHVKPVSTNVKTLDSSAVVTDTLDNMKNYLKKNENDSFLRNLKSFYLISSS